METSNPCASEYDDEGRALGHLLDAFGSLFTLRQIASAYTKAGHNVDLAGQILFELEGSTSSASTHTSDAELRDTKVVEMSSNDISEKPTRTDKSPKTSKPKRYSVSMGTVSSVIGKGYVGPSQVQVKSCEAIKPLKLDSKELPMADLWGEELSSDFTVKNDAMHKDVEDFLFKMLGDGFQLDMSVIREVLGCCGYDVKKTMERLLDLSESALDKSDDVVGDSSSKIAGKCPESESLLSRENSHHMSLAQSDGARVLNRNGKKSPTWDKERYDLQKEVLAALFNVPERTEEVPRTRPVKAVRRTRAVGHTVVVEPPSDTTTEHSTAIVESKQDIEDDGDDSYQVLRRATMEHWATMKEYYKAAVDAFAKGDRTRADELLQQGQFFNNKAREADEKSAQKILECRNNETQDEMCLDLHAHDSKEAIRLLKFHLTSISGIPSIQYLKVIMETNADDITKGARKRLVRKLLEKESIKWTEEGDGGTILIRVDEVNPKRLSFAKKPQ